MSALLAIALALALRADGDEVLAAAPKALLDRVLAEDSPALERWDDVYRSALLAHGDAGPLLRALRDAAGVKTGAPDREALRGLARIEHREGSLAKALDRVDQALAIRASDDLRLERAELLDALDRGDEALAAWRGLAADAADPALRDRAGLRAALLDTPKQAEGTSKGDGTVESDLHRVAKARGDRELAERAAIVLALLGRPAEAIDLFAPDPAAPAEEGSARFRHEVRLAEWSLAAGAIGDAREHAWLARSTATLARDRRYALTVLVEAYRASDANDPGPAKGALGALIDRFAAEPSLDAESRNVWIDLLRETSRVDEALALFRGNGDFTPDMRRELLEMCREAGRDDELVRTYGEVIAAEPERLDWREGLSRYWLERGRKDDAEAVWRDYLARFPDCRRSLAAAQSMRDLGLDALAEQAASVCLGGAADEGALGARMFLSDLAVRRGDVETALAELDAFDREAAPGAPQRVELAEAYERIGNQRRAVDVLEGIRAHRAAQTGEPAEEDLEMRLAWLLSEVGDEKKALERWRGLWTRVASVPRRRQVEDRLMAVASRLGVLSDIAVELEEKLADGKADDRDAALLVRLYQKVGDPVSAAEVIDEHMKQTGADPVATLNEKSRVYLAGKDYYHFERTVRRLVEIDPENREDHLRQLAMSNLERGRPQEARTVLAQIAAEQATREPQGSSSDAAEFEAGVLALAGLQDDAARAYRRGLAAHPERIDSYLLLGNAMKALGQTERAIGMFEFLAETADKDDLFTVAIDGILNMRAKGPALHHALRIALERLASRHDRMYLDQLVADLCDELEDSPGRMRALESSLAIAGEQRAAVLRELMDVAQGTGSSTFTVVNNVVVERRQGGDEKKRLAYGRRLIGLGDVVPPQVYLELGEAFLRAGEVANAARTFSMARDVPDYAAFQRQVAESFETAGFVENALAIYERAMASQGVDVPLLLKTGELNEQLGRDDRARELYRRGIEVLLARHPRRAAGPAKPQPDDEESLWSARNLTDFERCFEPLRQGFVACAGEDDAAALFAAQRALLDADLAASETDTKEPEPPALLADFPRVKHRAELLRDLSLRFDAVRADGDAVDAALLAAFPRDPELLGAVVASRAEPGLVRSARELAAGSGRSAADQSAALARAGIGGADAGDGPLALADVVARILPLLIGGDRDAASRLLRGVQLGEIRRDDLPQLQLLFAAALFLDDRSAIVTLGRHTMRTLVLQGTDDRGQQVDGLLKRAHASIDSESFGLIVEALLESLASKKEPLNELASLLPEVQRELGRPLFDGETLKQRIEACLPDRTYLLASLLELAPADERLAALQAVWSKVPATERSSVAITLLAGGEELPAPLADFALGAIEEGVEKLTDANMITFELSDAYESGDEHLPLIERIAKAVHAKFPSNVTVAAILAAARYRTGQHEAGIAGLDETLGLLPQEPEEYAASQAVRILVSAFVPAETDRVLAAVARLPASASRNAQRWQVQSAVYDKLGDEEAKRRALEEAAAGEDASIDVLQQLYWNAAGRGDVKGRIAALERLVAKDASNPTWATQLEQQWRILRNPPRALAVHRAQAPAAATPEGPPAKKLEPPAIEAVKTAFDRGAGADALAIWRRLWRTFARAGSSRFVFFSSYGSRELFWPAEPGAAQRTRGGLDLMKLDQPASDPAAGDANDDEGGDASSGAAPRRSAYDVMATLPGGLDALRRQARSLAPAQLQSSRPLIRGLAIAESSGPAGADAVSRWRADVQAGSAGKLEKSLLLAWLEDHLDSLQPEDRALLDALVAGVHPLDGSQLRALARIHARLREGSRAARIYQWCATLATSSRWSFGSAGAISAHELLEEVPKHLQGDDRIAAVEAILARSDPGGGAFEREEYLALAIDTWTKILGPKAALARCAKQVDESLALDHGILRNAAGAAVAALAANGETAKALRALEIALCRFEPGEVHFDREDAYSATWRLQPGDAGMDRIRAWFPGGESDAAWIEAVTGKLIDWHVAGRLHVNAVARLFAAAAVRLHARGNDALAARALERIGAAKRVDRLLQIDVERLLGNEAAARAHEDALLAALELDAERVPEVIDRIRKDEGDAKALERGAAAAEWSPHPKLLEQLIAIAGALGRKDEVARYEKLAAECKAAAQELKIEW